MPSTTIKKGKVHIMNFMELINALGVAAVPALVLIAFCFGLIAKNIKALDNKWIPVICMVTGAVFGVLALYTGMVGFEPTDWISAMAVGIVSGLGAVGVHQVWKQLWGKDAADESNAALMTELQTLRAKAKEYEEKLLTRAEDTAVTDKEV